MKTISIEVLFEALNASWCRETAYKSDRPFWSRGNITRGQCTVTAMVVNDFLGGQVMRGFSKKYNIIHYWNIVDNEKIDFTFDQFIGDKDDITFDKIGVKSNFELLKIGNVRSRYLLLRQKVDDYLAQRIS